MPSDQSDTVLWLQLKHFFSDDPSFGSMRVVSDFQHVPHHFHVAVLKSLVPEMAQEIVLLPDEVLRESMHRHILQRAPRILRLVHVDLKRGWTTGYGTK
uniref:Uncharacterized protein n=1 Tax=Caenorhabditis tropicalis TaxID=1561998 RepID=A0A1I7TSE7_9PELO